MLTLILCPFHPHVTAVAHKRPQSFCQKCRWQFTPKHAYTLTQRGRSGLTMPLFRHSVGTYQETNSHATRQGTLGCSRLSSPCHCGLILALRMELICAILNRADLQTRSKQTQRGKSQRERERETETETERQRDP